MGFDTGTETWIVRKGANLGLGRSHMDHPQLYAVSRAERNSPIDQFVIIELGAPYTMPLPSGFAV